MLYLQEKPDSQTAAATAQEFTNRQSSWQSH
jgi:hypothetical protein